MAVGDFVRTQIPGAVGWGAPGESVEKLTILHEEDVKEHYTGVIEALFNPNLITISKKVTWGEKETADSVTTLSFTPAGSKPATLTLDLFFDTYEGDRRAGDDLGAAAAKAAKESLVLGYPLAQYPLAGPSGVSVVTETERIAQLARINQELHRPPVCELYWGKFRIFLGVLTDLSQKFTLFLADGTPVRANLTCTFKRYRSDEEALKELDLRSANVPRTHTVRRGETLSSIAADKYNDPGLWRTIAEANGIHNPRALTPGQVLRVPRLKP